MPPTSPIRWLGVTATSGTDTRFTPGLVSACAAMTRAYPQMMIAVNFFDNPKIEKPQALVRRLAGLSSTGGASDARAHVEGHNVPGMKTLFWKLYLTPERTREMEVVWLFDSDIAVHPSAFPLGQLVGVLQATRATLIQPSVRALVHGTHHTFLRVRPAHMSCLATTAMWVEMQTPLFTGETWAIYHEKVLSHIADADLAASDFGIDISWCAALRDSFPDRPTCLVTPAEAATHLNTHAIEKFMQKEVINKVRSCAGTCQTLLQHYRRYWKNFSHHTTECYGVQLGPRQQDGLLRGGRFSIDSGSYARARVSLPSSGKFEDNERTAEAARSAASSAASIPDDVDTANASEPLIATSAGGMPGAELIATSQGVRSRAELQAAGVPLTNIWLGATSVASATGGLVGNLVAGVQALFRRVDNLKVIINLNDGPSDDKPRGSVIDISNDLRITTTWVPGPRWRFWRNVLNPVSGHMRGVSAVVLFDAAVGLHPAVSPLAMFIDAMYAADASVVFAPVDPPTPGTNGRPLPRGGTGGTEASADPANKNQSALWMSKCIALGSPRAVLAQPLTILRREVWALFHKVLLARLPNAPLAPAASNTMTAALAEQLDSGLCSLVAHAIPNRPSCVELRSPRVVSLDGLASAAEMVRERRTRAAWFAGSTRKGEGNRACSATPACAERVLESAIGAGAMATHRRIAQEPPLCWIYGQQKEGLSLNRMSRQWLNEVRSAKNGKNSGVDYSKRLERMRQFWKNH